MQSSTSSSASSPSPSFLERLKREVDEGGPASRSTSLLGHDEVPPDTAVFEIYDTTLLPPSPPPSPSALSTLRSTVLSSLPPYLSTYLWHHSPFTLQPSPPSSSPSSPLLPHLSGSLHYSHSLDDLYLLTSLLFHLSSSNSHLLLHLTDTDGHFLLVDAAHALPPHLPAPSALIHRVWITRGHLHIIPTAIHTRDDGARYMAAEAARGGTATLAPPAVQAAIRERLAPYPALALQRNVHRVRCMLPVLAARVLREEGGVLGGVAAALETRDLLDVRVANKMAAFLPSSPPSRVVPRRVRFSRLLYAQVQSQVMALPRGLQAHPALGGYMEGLSAASPMRHAWTVGVKLMMGMEMYLAQLRGKQRKEQTEKAARTAARAERELKRGKRRAELLKKGPMTEEQVERELRGVAEKKRKWRAFLGGLQKAGWFDGTKRGEELWKQQMTLGLLLFEEEEEKRGEGERTEEKVAHALSETERRHLEVMERVLRQSGDQADGEKAAEGWPKWDELEADDSDEWMHVDPDELEATINNAKGDDQRAREPADRPRAASTPKGAEGAASSHSASKKGDEVKEESLRSARAAVSGVKGFLAHVSSHEGAELPSDRADKAATATSAQRTAESQSSATARHQRLMAALASDADGIEAAVRAYEAEYGQGSFDSDLMQSVVQLQLEGDEQPQPPLAANAAEDERKEAARPHTLVEEDEDDDMGGADEESGMKDDESEDVDEELLFGGEKGSLRGYLSSMDVQLRAAGLGSEFVRGGRGKEKGEKEEEGEEEDDEDEVEEGSEGIVDKDLNLLKNLLSSFASQNGSAGPASNLLGAMGIQLPREDRTKPRRDEQ